MDPPLLGVLTGVQVVDSQSIALHTVSELQNCNSGGQNGALSLGQDDGVASFDENDLFQCGKCGKQFNSIAAFVTHKREPCMQQLRSSVLPNISSTAAPSILHFSSPLTSTASSVGPVQIATSFEAIATTVSQNVISESEFLSVNGLESSTITIPVHSLTSSEAYLTPVSSPLSVTSPIVGSISAMSPITVPLQNVSIGTQLNTSTLLAVKTVPATFSKETSIENHLVLDQNGVVTDGSSSFREENKNLPDGEILKYDLVIKFQNEDPAIIDDGALNDNLFRVDPMISSQIDAKLKKRTKIVNSKTDLVGRNLSKLLCTYCGKGFTKKFDLEQHVRSHTGEKPFQCLVCGRAFAQRSNVKKHMQTHKVWPVEISHTLIDKRKITDETKDFKQIEERDGSELSSSDILVDTSYVCQFCSQTFPVYGQLKSHLKQHKSEQVYKCIVKSCNNVFKDLDTYLEHTRSHENDMNYRCHICSKLYNSLSDLSLHQFYHEAEVKKPSNKKVFSCNTCQNKYSSLNSLDHHRSMCSHHFPCPYCEKVYQSERFLRRHMVTHNSVSSHKCETCEKYFKTEHYLRLHTLIHSGDKPFQCPQCAASFNRKDKLKRHLLIHEPVKRFKCPFRTHTGCTKEFHRPDKLKAHIITHSGIKPYQCCHCKRTFSRCSTLKMHVKQVHSEGGTLICTICREGFENEKRLIEHTCSKETQNKSAKRQTNSACHLRYGRLHSKRCGNFTNQTFGNRTDKSHQKQASGQANSETDSKETGAKFRDDGKPKSLTEKKITNSYNTCCEIIKQTMEVDMETADVEEALVNFEST